MFGVAISRATGSGALLAFKNQFWVSFPQTARRKQQTVKVQNVEKKPKDSDMEKGVRQVTCQRWADSAAGGVILFNF